MGGSNAEKSNGRSALNFELQWLKFLRDAEEDYVTRLIRVSAILFIYQVVWPPKTTGVFNDF